MNNIKKVSPYWKYAVAMFSCVFLAPIAVCDQIDEPTILGALSDAPSRIAAIGNRDVIIYQAANNEMLRRKGHYSDATLYYEYQPSLRRSADKKVDVQILPYLQSRSKKLVQFTIVPADIDRPQLLKLIKETQIDPYARLENLSPIPIFGLEVKLLLGGKSTYYPIESATPFNRPFTVGVPVDITDAQAIADAIKNGAGIEVKYFKLVKLTQKTETNIKWSEVKKTKTFRDYNGPSSPSMITAAQVLDAAQSILSEMNVFHWAELDANNTGGATPQDYKTYLDTIVDRFLVSRKSKLADFDAWVNTQRFDVPMDKFHEMADVTRKIAIDAKNLNNDEWCKKYSDQIKSLNKSSSARNSPASLGIKLGIPGILDFGLDGKESTTSSTSENTYEQISSSEDCGKKLVENNYKYEFDGTK